MISANLPSNEKSRLQNLYQTELLDSPHEKEFDDIVRLASQLCNMPISLISLVDSNRQWFKARVGIEVDQTNRDISFCSHAILQDELFEIPDATQDERFFDNPLVTDDPQMKYYAGVPLITSTGSRLGTLCVIDRIPRQLTEQQRFGLQVLADSVMKIAELRIRNKHLNYLTQTQKRIISILAHDVRSPLTSLKSVIEFRNSDILSENEAADMMSSISLQLDSTLDMIENVVDWGAMQIKFDKFTYEDINLHELVQRVSGAEVLNSSAKKNIFINNVEPDLMLKSDRRVVEFILRNLLNNANKFTDEGTIMVIAGKNDDQTIIRVQDSGVGMQAGLAEKLFDGTANMTTYGTNREKGNGIGLMLVKEFVDRLNGTIYAESVMGNGSSFTLIL